MALVSQTPHDDGLSPPYISANHAELGDYALFADGGPELLFCENETNTRRLFGSDGGMTLYPGFEAGG